MTLRYSEEINAYVAAANCGTKPYTKRYIRGVLLISFVTDQNHQVIARLRGKGYVHWRLVNDKPIARRVRLKARCVEGNVVWDPHPKVQGEYYHAEVVAERVEPGATCCEEGQASASFSIVRAGTETIQSTCRTTGDRLSSKFYLVENNSEGTVEDTKKQQGDSSPHSADNTYNIGTVHQFHSGSGNNVLEKLVAHQSLDTKEELLDALRQFKKEIDDAKIRGVSEPLVDDAMVEVGAAELEMEKGDPKAQRVIKRLESAKTVLQSGVETIGSAAAATVVVNQLVRYADMLIEQVRRLIGT